MRRFILVVAAAIVMAAGSWHANALGFDLDTVATWGKFPRFCVNTYRWGDRFFNTYDSTYVVGTGYKFNVKFKIETWFDNYMFYLPDDYEMRMFSDPNTTMGFYVTYLAVSLGYDFSTKWLFGGPETRRKKWNFKFNCALGSVELYWVTNNIDTRITSFGKANNLMHPGIRFSGVDNSLFGLDLFYFFNNKRYSRAAAFNYSKIQRRSQGSFFLGFSYWYQSFNYDFNQLPDYMKEALPQSWKEGNFIYHTANHNYTLRGGYAYNWVFHPHWVLGISESPLLGVKHGRINSGKAENTLSLYNRAQLSTVWHNSRWFAGLVLTAENGLIYDKEHSMLSGIFYAEASVGFRFNLW